MALYPSQKRSLVNKFLDLYICGVLIFIAQGQLEQITGIIWSRLQGSSAVDYTTGFICSRLQGSSRVNYSRGNNTGDVAGQWCTQFYKNVTCSYNNNNVYLIKHPYQQEPFKSTVQIICNIIIPQIICLLKKPIRDFHYV